MTDRLDCLRPGASAVIDSIEKDYDWGARLQSLGFRPGAVVQVLRSNRNCMHVRIGSTEWAIRHKDAESVKIIPENPSKVHGRDC